MGLGVDKVLSFSLDSITMLKVCRLHGYELSLFTFCLCVQDNGDSSCVHEWLI